MAAEGKRDLTWLWVTLAAVAIVGFFVFRQSIAPVTTSKINLVPEGTQKAYNWQGINGNQYYTNPYDRDMAYYDMQAAQAYAQADQNIAYAQQAGNFLNNLTDNIFG